MARLFVNQLTVIDCSCLDPDSGLVGESWAVDLELAGNLDAQGMVLDFGVVKRSIRQVIDDYADHKLLVPARWPGLTSRADRGQTQLVFVDRIGRAVHHTSPESALCVLDTERVDAGSLTAHLQRRLSRSIPDNVSDVVVRLRTEETDGAYYRYSHGLKKHGGACQRIAHGHRSRLVVYENGRRSERWERHWAQKWRDIYLASRDDEVPASAPNRLRFSYRASEGEFTLELDRDRCYMLDSESTVECIAEHLVRELKRLSPASSFRVHAFEGLNKGAIAESQSAPVRS